MVNQTGTKLSVIGENFYRGASTHNGILEDIHTNCIKKGYARFLKADGSDIGVSAFGNGVWYDANQNNNIVYAGAPTVTNAKPVFAGILEREPMIAESVAFGSDVITGDQNGQAVIQGVLVYKKGKVFSTGVVLDDALLCKFVYVGFYLACSASDGSFYFTAKKAQLENTGDVIVGRVIRTDNDMQCVEVYISPIYLDELSGTPTITSLTFGTPTTNSVPATIVAPQAGSAKLSYKKTADTDFIDIDGEFMLVFDSANSNYKLDYEFINLESATEYTFKVVLSTPDGLVSTTGTATTA